MGLMNSIQDLLKEVKPQLGDLSERDADIYTDIRRGMKQDQDEATMRGYEEELRKILKKKRKVQFKSQNRGKKSNFPKMTNN